MRYWLNQAVQQIVASPRDFFRLTGRLIKWCVVGAMLLFAIILVIDHPRHALIAFGFILGFKILSAMAGGVGRDDDPTLAQRNTITSIDSERR